MVSMAALYTEEYLWKGSIYVMGMWKSEGTEGHPGHRVPHLERLGRWAESLWL